MVLYLSATGRPGFPRPCHFFSAVFISCRYRGVRIALVPGLAGFGAGKLVNERGVPLPGRGRARAAPGGGPGLPPGGRGQAVRAVTARAMAWLVAAGSARMTTRVPFMVVAVSVGAIQRTWQPEAASQIGRA